MDGLALDLGWPGLDASAGAAVPACLSPATAWPLALALVILIVVAGVDAVRPARGPRR